MAGQRFRKALVSAVARVTAFWILLVAAYLALGRQFFPYVSQLQPEIEAWLTSQVGNEVTIGEVQGDWLRFNPILTLKDVSPFFTF